MKKTLSEIFNTQEAKGIRGIQKSIETGDVWDTNKLKAHIAGYTIRKGVCVLGEICEYNHDGEITLPSRYDVEEGTEGSTLFVQKFWESVDEGRYSVIVLKIFGVVFPWVIRNPFVK